MITERHLVVRLGRLANNPPLTAAGYTEAGEVIPWLGNRVLRLRGRSRCSCRNGPCGRLPADGRRCFVPVSMRAGPLGVGVAALR